jgi:probable rRNA maturation factor
MLSLCTFRDAKTRLPLKRIKTLFESIARDEQRPGWQGTINLVFTDDRTIQRLNRVHRRKDKPTDVLSFSVDAPDSRDAVYGEIYISCATAKRQAKAYGATLVDEYLRLVCHGLLHLYGYDHVRTAEAVVMREREDRYLSQV